MRNTGREANGAESLEGKAQKPTLHTFSSLGVLLALWISISNIIPKD
jgi:hypothetical protein